MHPTTTQPTHIPLSALTIICLLASVFPALAADDIRLEPRVQAMPRIKAAPYTKLADGSALTVQGKHAYITTDDGQTWLDPIPLFPNGPDLEVSNERVLTRTRDGAIIVGFMNLNSRNWGWDDAKNAPDRDVRLDTWTIRSLDEGRTWQDAQRVQGGWCGAVRDIIQTTSGRVGCRVAAGAREIEVDMGRVSFRSEDIPVRGTKREVLRETLELEGERLVLSAATLGNPHCVVERDRVLEEDCLRLGPRLERHSLFPHRTNVQFLRVLDPQNLEIEIWERGAGRTLSSGSSSCAAAAVARRLRLCEPSVHVRMPGGVLDVHVAEDFSVRLVGPASPVLDGRLGEALLPERWRDG